MQYFDPESGQVYRETTVKRQRFEEWDRSFCGKRPRDALSPTGSDTLKAMVLRKLVCHAEQLGPETLAAVPSEIALQVLTAIRRERCETLHTFKNFALSGHSDRTSRYAINAPILYKPFVNFVLDMASPKFSWMVDLTLSDLYCSRLDLRELYRLDNLSALTVTYQQEKGQKPFDDEVLSNLAHRAGTGGSLHKLCMLFVRNSQGISEKSLGCVSKFPAMNTFCVMGTSIKSKRTHRSRWGDWLISTDTTLHSYFEERNARSIYDTFIPCLGYADLARKYIQKHRSSTHGSYGDLPVADVTLGPHQSGPTSTQGILSHLVCFVRQKKVRPADETPSVLSVSPATEDHQDVQKPQLKKRKLKATKSVGLDRMLEGL